MRATEFVLGMLSWMWDHPWSILVWIALITLASLWFRRRSSDYFFERGLPRCHTCLDGSKSRNKVVHFSRESAEKQAQRDRQTHGKPMRVYRVAPVRLLACGFSGTQSAPFTAHLTIRFTPTARLLKGFDYGRRILFPREPYVSPSFVTFP